MARHSPGYGPGKYKGRSRKTGRLRGSTQKPKKARAKRRRKK